MDEHDFDLDPLCTIYHNPQGQTYWIKLISPDNPQWYVIRHVNGIECMSKAGGLSLGLAIYLLPEK